MNCLVTGSAGYIGNALTQRLIENNYKVFGSIHIKEPKNKIENVKYLKGSITDIKFTDKITKDIDIVFHCAAYVKDYGKWKKFYNNNYIGTKNLILSSQKNNVKKFIYLGHLPYESNKPKSYYSKSKEMAEKVLYEKYETEGFPIVIIHPGNVFGLGDAIWVKYVIESIKKDKIRLIDNGLGIFQHTYIDNLTNALLLTINNKNAIGQTFIITDGDDSITFGKYINDLAKIYNKSVNKNLSKSNALIISKIYMFLNKCFGLKPGLTPFVVQIFANKKKISINKAQKILNYKPNVKYNEAIEKIGNSILIQKL
jgi:nucleoside-diphosphate-sugar epimerase